MGRFQQCFKPEDLPGSSTIIQSFRVKGRKCNGLEAIISLTHFPGSSHKKNLFKNEKENFYCGCCFIQQFTVRTARQYKKFR
jgi:hypothetical protein